jgi:hypothetical protein
MKLFIPFLLLIVISCKKASTEVKKSRIQLESIKQPNLFLDTFSLGELATKDKISKIKKYSYGWDNYYYFDYYPNTNKLKSVLYIPQAVTPSCAFTRYDFFYSKEKIDSVQVVSPSSGCKIVVHTFRFDYFPVGALKSITEINDFTIDETFFSYNNSGRVEKIYLSNRYKTETSYHFSEISFVYDLAGNVSEVSDQPVDKITTKVTYQYGTIQNPFKGNYILRSFLSVFGWDEAAPFYLSKNVVSLTTRHYIENGAVQSFPYIVRDSSNRLFQFYYADQFGSTIFY